MVIKLTRHCMYSHCEESSTCLNGSFKVFKPKDGVPDSCGSLSSMVCILLSIFTACTAGVMCCRLFHYHVIKISCFLYARRIKNLDKKKHEI